jgi:hypothetical protein
VVDERLAHVGATDEHLVEAGRCTALRDGLVEDGMTGERGQRRQLRRLPDDGVTADQCHGGVPGPDGGGEVERADHTHDAERVPGLHQPVTRTLRGHRLAVELAGEAHGEVADVDHLLDLTARLGGDLSDLEADQCGQVVLVDGQQLAQSLDQGASGRSGNCAPFEERRVRTRDTVVDGGALDPGQVGEMLTVDGRGGRHVTGNGPQVHATSTGCLEGELAKCRAAWDLVHVRGHVGSSGVLASFETWWRLLSGLHDVELGPKGSVGEAGRSQRADIDDGRPAEVEVTHDLSDRRAHQEAVAGEACGVQEA